MIESWPNWPDKWVNIFGPKGCGKEYVVDNLLRKIYGNIETKEIEYIISGYSNSKEKVMINQSRYHIIIEPNNNGFDKYLIQEIIFLWQDTLMLVAICQLKMQTQT